MKKTFCLYFLVLLGCESVDINTRRNTGSDYFPLKVGMYWIYTVNETNITQLGGQTNSIYDLKIQITDSIPSEGLILYRLQRYSRVDESQPWTALDTWSSRRDPFEAVQQEGNIPYIKMAFPLSEGKTWNGNALNNLGGNDKCADGTLHCQNYQVTDLNRQFQDNGVSFDDSVTIVENNEDDSIVSKDVRKSVYAKKVGLVYREVTTLEYCTIGNCIGQQIVENGKILKQTLKAYGGA